MDSTDAPSSWNITWEYLARLVENRNSNETRRALADMGTQGLLQKLRTSIDNGITDSEEVATNYEERRRRYVGRPWQLPSTDCLLFISRPPSPKRSIALVTHVL